MKIAFIHLGGLNYILPSTSILKRVEKYKGEFVIDYVFGDHNRHHTYINKYNKLIRNTMILDEFLCKKDEYDLFVNLYPIIPSSILEDMIYDNAYKIGFQFNKNNDIYEDILIGGKENNKINLFQIYYNIMGWTWKGEGYHLSYYPRTRTKKNNVGISVSNSNLRNFILDKLKLNTNKIYYVPYKKNLFKRMDEINKCDKIITDDIMVLNLALFLRKYVYFLNTFPINYNIELFSNGEIIEVSLDNI